MCIFVLVFSYFGFLILVIALLFGLYMSFRTPQIPVEGMCRAIINWLLQATDKFIEIHIEYHIGRMLFFLKVHMTRNFIF